MIRSLLFVALLSLAACVTPKGSTIEQKLYAAHGAYNIALKQAVNYAETPSADASVVKAIAATVRVVNPSIRVAEDVAICTAKDKAPEVVAYCNTIALTAGGMSAALEAIQRGTVSLSVTLAKTVVTK